MSPKTDGYPKLLAKAGNLQQSTINIFNAVNLFDEIPDAVYADDCCHYNDAGNQILAEYMARNIVNAFMRLESTPKPVAREGH